MGFGYLVTTDHVSQTYRLKDALFAVYQDGTGYYVDNELLGCSRTYACASHEDAIRNLCAEHGASVVLIAPRL